MEMNTNIESRKLFGIEILRVLAMIMIIGHHLVYYGVQQYYDQSIAGLIYAQGSTINKILCQILIPGGVVGVAVFFMISGYLSFSIKSNNLRKTMFKTVLYSILGCVICCGFLVITGNDPVSAALLKNTVKCMFPIGNSNYWFITVYVLLIMLHPVLVKFEKLDNAKQLLLILLLFVEYFVGKYLLSPYFALIEGIFYYLIGFYSYLHHSKITTNKRYILLFFTGWTGYVVLANAVFPLSGNIGICLFGTLAAMGLFLAVLPVKSNEPSSVHLISRFTLDVYLIHEHPLVREILWRDLLKTESLYLTDYFAFGAILSIFILFGLGVMIGGIVQFIYVYILDN